MKKILIPIALLLLSGCAKELTEDDVKELQYDMSQSETIDLLGEPEYRTEDPDEILEKYNTITYIYFEELDENSGDVYGELLKYGPIEHSLTSKENPDIEVLQYTVDDHNPLVAFYVENSLEFYIYVNTSEVEL